MSIASTNDPTGVITAAKIATANSAQWILRLSADESVVQHADQYRPEHRGIISFWWESERRRCFGNGERDRRLGIQYRFRALVIHLHCAARAGDVLPDAGMIYFASAITPLIESQTSVRSSLSCAALIALSNDSFDFAVSPLAAYASPSIA